MVTVKAVALAWLEGKSRIASSPTELAPVKEMRI
jgi:hypothetical protein